MNAHLFIPTNEQGAPPFKSKTQPNTTPPAHTTEKVQAEHRTPKALIIIHTAIHTYIHTHTSDMITPKVATHRLLPVQDR